MDFDLDLSIEALRRSPATLHAAGPCAGRRVAPSLSAIREAAVTPLQQRLKPGALP